VPLATYYMGVDESRNRIYAGSNSSAMIYVIDGLTDLVVDSIPIGGGFGVSQFAVDPANNRILVPTQICVISPGPPPVCSDVQFLAMFDAGSHALLDTVRIVHQGFAAAYNAVTNRAYVAILAGPDTVKVIDAGSGVAGSAHVVDSLQPGSAISSLANVAVNPVTNMIYVTDYNDNAVHVISGASDSVVTSVFVGGQPEGMAVDTIANRIYATSYASTYMYVVDGATNGVVQVINLGAAMSQAAAVQGAGRVYTNVYPGSAVKVLKF